MIRSVVMVGVLIAPPVMLLHSGPVRAQTVEARAQAKSSFEKGRVAYERKDYVTAKAAFEEAYAALPLKGFWFNIAQCEYQLGHYAAAASAYEKYLTDNAKVRDRALVESYLEESRARAQLSKTEQKALQAAQSAEEAAKTAQRAEQERQAAEESRKQVEAALLAAEQATAAERAQREQLEQESQSVFKQWWFWTAIAGGAALAAGAAAGGGVGYWAWRDLTASEGTLGSEQLGN